MFLLAAATAMIPLADPDLWWHLAGGKLVLEKGFPLVNSFSHTFPDYPWKHTQWLFDVILRVWELLGGVQSVELAQVLLVGLAFVVTADTVRIRLGRFPLVPLLFLVVLAVVASRFRFAPRPHLISFVGLALLLNFWERRPRRLPVWFGMCGLVWANCHAGVVLGIPVIGAFAAASLMRQEYLRFRTALVCLVSFFLASLLNPHFTHPYLYILQNLDIKDVVPLVEYRSANLQADPLFFLFASLVAFAVPWRLRRKDLVYPLLATVFFFLALSVVRFIPKFVLVTFPGLAVTVSEVWDEARARGWRIPAVCGASLLLILSLGLARHEYFRTRIGQPFGWGINEILLPKGAADFVEKTSLVGHMYNDFGQGGYLAWRFYPGRLVFQDGRALAYPTSFFGEILGSTSPERWSALMDKHRIDYAVVARRPDLKSRIDMGPFFDALGWPLVYLDGISYVFVRPGTGNEERTRELSLQPLAATDTATTLQEKAGRFPVAMAAAIGRIDPARLLFAEDFLRFGNTAFWVGDLSLGERFFLKGIEMHPEDPVLRYNLALVYLRQQRPDKVRFQLLETIRVARGHDVGRLAERRLRQMSSTP